MTYGNFSKVCKKKKKNTKKLKFEGSYFKNGWTDFC